MWFKSKIWHYSSPSETVNQHMVPHIRALMRGILCEALFYLLLFFLKTYIQWTKISGYIILSSFWTYQNSQFKIFPTIKKKKRRFDQKESANDKRQVWIFDHIQDKYGFLIGRQDDYNHFICILLSIKF